MHLTNGEVTHETENPIMIDAFLKSGYYQTSAPKEASKRSKSLKEPPQESPERDETPDSEPPQ